MGRKSCALTPVFFPFPLVAAFLEERALALALAASTELHSEADQEVHT